MKKIIFTTMLAMCLCGCGNVEKTEIKLPQINDELIKNEDNILENIQVKEENNIESAEEKKNDEKDDKGEEKQSEMVNNEEPIVLQPEEKVENSLEEDKKEEVVYEYGVEIGKKAVDFEIELLSGEKVKLSDYIGKPVFLNFWATWCGPCVGEMPHIQKIKDTYGDKIVILAVNSGELKEDVKFFADRKGYTFEFGLNEKGDLLDTYKSMYIPLSVFIDEKGIIQERSVGALSEEQMLNIVKDLVGDNK